MSRIPPRQPLGDAISGAIVLVDDQHVLTSAPLTDAEVVHSGTFVVRYGIEYLGKPQYSIVPGLLALDYGDMLTGEDAWDFIFRRSNLYPRADVVGYRNDGEDEMIVLKQLDLEAPVHVLAYADDDATKPLAHLRAAIVDAAVNWPSRLWHYLPRYTTLADWRAARHA